jgi:hypothetical protein
MEKASQESIASHYTENRTITKNGIRDQLRFDGTLDEVFNLEEIT